jgi:hypothetical protein
MAKDILKPVDTTNSSSPTITRAAGEPKNWRAQGATSPQQAIKEDPRKAPVCPKKLKK